MSNVAKLKRRALEYEQKKQLDRALEAYEQVFAAMGTHVEEADVALYNHVGDLLLRTGDVSGAVDHYEKAVDLYTDGGFFNNAIALCNKILRNAPGRSSVYYKLGKISARKGFVTDAKQKFLEYADRMQRAGDFEEAFRALKEFADLCPDQDEIRLMLADQLVRRDRKEEAIEQLQILYDKLESEGRPREAQAALERMRAIDPDLQPKRTTMRPTPKANELIFLEVDYDEPIGSATRRPSPVVHVAPIRTPDDAEPPRAEEDAASVLDHARDQRHDDDDDALSTSAPLPLIEYVEPENDAVSGELVAGFTPTAIVDHTDTSADTRVDSVVSATPVTGVEPSFEDAGHASAEAVVDAPPVPGFEPTSLADESQPISEVEAHSAQPVPEFESMEIMTADPLGSLVGDAEPTAAANGLELIVPPDDASELGAGLREADESELPLMLADALLPDPLEAQGEEIADTPMQALPLIFPEPGAEGEVEAELTPVSDGLALVDGAPATVDVDTQDVRSEEIADEQSRVTADAPPSEVDDTLPVDAAEASPVDADDSPSPDPELVERPVDRLRTELELAPDDWDLHRRLGEALLEAGERDAGIQELDAAMLGYERAGDLSSASALAEELLLVEPGNVGLHQKRVEYAVRANDKGRLVDAYAALADCLLRSGQLEKARAVYKRVLELAPDDARVLSALATLGGDDADTESPDQRRNYFPTPRAVERAVPVADAPVPAPAAVVEPQPPLVVRAPTPTANEVVVNAMPRASASATRDHRGDGVAVQGGDGDFVDLAAWLREDEPARSTRMVVDLAEPEDQEQVEFAEMLELFKRGIAANVDDMDHESHYDLGVAYKEMGLLDEAISEFQKALRGTERRVRTYEALGQCFVEKEQYQIALTILTRALADRNHSDDTLVGVLYLLGCASEALGRQDDARRYYERVFAVDIQFRDVADRLTAMDRVAR